VPPGTRSPTPAARAAAGNIRIEVVCSSDLARRIADHLRRHYYDDYAMIIFENDVRVLRPDKFA